LQTMVRQQEESKHHGRIEYKSFGWVDGRMMDIQSKTVSVGICFEKAELVVLNRARHFVARFER
jgi:hypothetical protein